MQKQLERRSRKMSERHLPKITNHDTKVLIPRNSQFAKCKPYLAHDSDLLVYGKETISHIAGEWEREQTRLHKIQKELDKLLYVLENNSLEDIQAQSDDVDEIAWGEREAACLKMSMDATTFKYCGWCKYCQQTKMGGGCKQEGLCGFMRESAERASEEVEKSTECLLAEMTEEELDEIHGDLNLFYEEIDFLRRDCAKRAKRLRNLKDEAEEKPVMFFYRTINWYQHGAEVVYINAGAPSKRVRTGKICGYNNPQTKQDDITVQIILDDDNTTMGIGINSPCLLTKDEFQFFCDHRSMLYLWTNAAKHLSPNFPKENFEGEIPEKSF